MKRILYHHRTQADDAQGIHVFEMVKAFRKLGHEVNMASLVVLGEMGEKKTKGRGWQWLTKWVPSWLYEIMTIVYNLYGYRLLCQSIKLSRPDMIYERYSLNTFCGIWASYRYGIPLLLEVNAPLYHEQKSLGKLSFERFARFSERWICSNSTHTIVVSSVMKNILIREGIPDEKITVVQNGIDPEEYTPEISGKAVREKYGLEEKLVIGFVGWFRPWHGLERLLEIMNKAHLAEEGVRLLLVGDGPAYSDLYHYAETNHLLSEVIFVGPVRRQEMATYIAAMDITVQPSATEYACPMKIFEYMAMGKCVIAPDQPNIKEILEDRVNCYLFKPSDEDHFKEVLLAAIYDQTGRKKVGLMANKTIYQKRYLWTANARKALALVFGNNDREDVPIYQQNKVSISGGEIR